MNNVTEENCAIQEKNIDIDNTIQYYDDHAEEFTANTISADMEEIRLRFLARLPAGSRILDFGCGTGRDTKAFRSLGYVVDAIDGSDALCHIASAYTGLSVQCRDFREYKSKEEGMYDGVWACASLLHLKKQELQPVLHELGRSLRLGGILYVSFKYGEFEGLRNGRYFTDFTLEGFARFMHDIPEYRRVEHWITGDVRPGRGDERWLNMLWERVEIRM